MAWCFAAEMVQVRVAELANSPAIGCHARLDLKNFIPKISYPRITQRLPKARYACSNNDDGDGAIIQLHYR